MSDLTEVEIFDCLTTNFREATENCRKLALRPAQGPTYIEFRRNLKLIEGACRQAGHWRRDARWLQLGLMMEEAHKRAGTWIWRKYPRPLFLKLAENLEYAYRSMRAMRDNATGRVGAILPEMGKLERADTVPVSYAGYETTSAGLIVPKGTAREAASKPETETVSE